MDKSLHLESVIKTHQITKEEQLLNKHKEKDKEVKEALEEKYGDSIYSPFNTGSYAKNTAMNTKFDFDMELLIYHNLQKELNSFSYHNFQSLLLLQYSFYY